MLSSLRVMIVQHPLTPGHCLFVFSTAEPHYYEVWQVPMPYHSLSFPVPSEICRCLSKRVQLDPHSFIRNKGPGKALFCFAEKLPHAEPYVDVFTFSPTDLSAGTWPHKEPLWAVTRFFGSDDPFLFWKSVRQQFLGFSGRGHSPTSMLDWFVRETVGLQTLQSWLCGPGAGGNPGLLRHKL